MLHVNGGTNDLTERARYYERCLGRDSLKRSQASHANPMFD
jgi:hypothetical protein